MNRRLRLALLGPLALPLLAAAAPTAPLEKSQAQIADDIAFAKGLAKEWGFVDLAGEVIRTIEKEGVGATTAERLGVVKCEIFAQGAMSERDREKRNELFEQALSAYDDFLTQNPNSPAAPEARSGFVTMSVAYATALEIAMEEALGEQAESLRNRRREVLLAANDLTRDLIGEIEASLSENESEGLRRELVNMMIQRAKINLEIGKSSEEGAYSFEEAKKLLESVTFIAGDGSPGALRAYDMIGQVNAAEQKWEEAAIFFEAVVNSAIPLDLYEWQTLVKDFELSQADKEQRWLFVELSTKGLVEALLSDGNVEGATGFAMHLYNTQRREGFEFSTQLGYPSLLAAARTLLDAGGVLGGNLNRGEARWYETVEAAADAGHKNPRNRISGTDLALRIAQQVVSENQGNVLRIQGQKLIADITSRPGIEVDPEILYEAAEGKYFAEENEAALDSFKLVLAALEGKDKATRIEIGPKTFLRMGRIYLRMDRTFEAAMAFREGCTTYVGDPENDAFNAQGYYRAMQDLTSRAPDDASLKALYLEAENLAADLSTRDQNEIWFDKGERARRNKDWETAISAYEQVNKAGNDYEKALVWIAVSKYRSGKRDEGYRAMVDYLENYVTDSTNTVQGAKEIKRGEATATAGFYRCFHEFASKQYDQVLSSSSDYNERFPDQTSYAPLVLRMVSVSHAEKGDMDAAKAALQTIMSDYPENGVIATLGIELYKKLGSRRKGLEAGSEEDLDLAREMALLMQLGNKFASSPSFPNLRAEARHWIELGDWTTAVPVLETIASSFGSDEKVSKEMLTYVLPDLAHGYLELREVPKAYAILTDLIANEGRKPSKRTLLDYTRAVIGWVQGSASNIEEVPGAGQTKEDYSDATDKLNALANSVDMKWTCEWYELKFHLAYGYYKWATAEGGPKDSKKKDAAKRQLSALVQQLGNDFKGQSGVPGVNETCEGEADYAGRLGEDVLRRRMVWLWQKVK